MARLAAMQSPMRSLRVRHEPQHNIDFSHVPTNHSPACQAKRVFLVTAIRPHGGKRYLSTILDAITYFKRRVVARFELAVAQRDSKEVIL